MSNEELAGYFLSFGIVFLIGYLLGFIGGREYEGD
jgi:hypothetical protein